MDLEDCRLRIGLRIGLRLGSDDDLNDVLLDDEGIHNGGSNRSIYPFQLESSGSA